MADDVANDARYNPTVSVNGGPSPAALDNDADDEDGDAFIHDDMLECQVLWEMATESVFELADKLDDSDNKK
jgi:hypothetical protein